MASEAFTIRFRSTCSICPGSACTRPSGSASCTLYSMSSRSSRCSSRPISTINSFKSRILGCSICLRLNASNCRVSNAARSATRRICSQFPCTASVGLTRSSARSLFPLITVNKLLKSCATPPANRPSASIFCACRSCSSSCSRCSWLRSSVLRMLSNARVTRATSSPPSAING